MIITFTIPGVPVAKQRHRSVILKRCRDCGRKTVRKVCLCGKENWEILTTMETTDKETRTFENQVGATAREELLKLGISELVTGKIKIEMNFFFFISESRACTGTRCKGADCKRLHDGDDHSQRPDLDNCIKSILDGMNKTILADDSQVTQLTASKRWSKMPRAEVKVEVL